MEVDGIVEVIPAVVVVLGGTCVLAVTFPYAVIFDDSVLRSVLVDVLTNIVDLVVDEDEVRGASVLVIVTVLLSATSVVFLRRVVFSLEAVVTLCVVAEIFDVDSPEEAEVTLVTEAVVNDSLLKVKKYSSFQQYKLITYFSHMVGDGGLCATLYNCKV